VSGVLSGKGICNGPIPRPEKSYRLRCVIACNLETSRMRRPWSALDCCARERERERETFFKGNLGTTENCLWQKNLQSG
jgi:hypothetical protein